MGKVLLTAFLNPPHINSTWQEMTAHFPFSKSIKHQTPRRRQENISLQRGVLFPVLFTEAYSQPPSEPRPELLTSHPHPQEKSPSHRNRT